MQLVTVVVNVSIGFGAIAMMMRTLRWRGRVFAPEEGLATGPAASPTAPTEPTRVTVEVNSSRVKGFRMVASPTTSAASSRE